MKVHIILWTLSQVREASLQLIACIFGRGALLALPACSWHLIPLSSLLPYRDCSSRPVKVTQTGSRHEKGRQTRKIFTYLILIFKLVWPFQWLPLVIFYAAFENLSIWPTSKHSYSGLLKQGRENSSADSSVWTQQLSSIPLYQLSYPVFSDPLRYSKILIHENERCRNVTRLHPSQLKNALFVLHPAWVSCGPVTSSTKSFWFKHLI